MHKLLGEKMYNLTTVEKLDDANVLKFLVLRFQNELQCRFGEKEDRG
jgi:hypothetical protein